MVSARGARVATLVPVALAAAALVASSACGRPHQLARLDLRSEPRCAPCSGALAKHFRAGSSPGDERGPFENWHVELVGGETLDLRVPKGLGLPLPPGAAPLLEVRHEREVEETTTSPIVKRERLWITDRGTGEIVWASGGGTLGSVDLPGLRAEMETADGARGVPRADPCGTHELRRVRFVPDPGAARAPRPKRLWPGERARLKIGGKPYRVHVVAATRGPTAPKCPGYVGTEFSFILVRLGRVPP